MLRAAARGQSSRLRMLLSQQRLSPLSPTYSHTLLPFAGYWQSLAEACNCSRTGARPCHRARRAFCACCSHSKGSRHSCLHIPTIFSPSTGYCRRAGVMCWWCPIAGTPRAPGVRAAEALGSMPTRCWSTHGSTRRNGLGTLLASVVWLCLLAARAGMVRVSGSLLFPLGYFPFGASWSTHGSTRRIGLGKSFTSVSLSLLSVRC